VGCGLWCVQSVSQLQAEAEAEAEAEACMWS
jgi:hypothetical protein